MSRRGYAALVFAFLALSVPLFAADEPVFETEALVYNPPTLAQERAAQISDLVLAAPRMLEEHKHRVGPLSMVEQAKLYAESEEAAKGVLRVGIHRAVPQDVRLMDIPSELDVNSGRSFRGGLLERGLDGSVTWSTAISSEGAGAIRINLRANGFPAESRAYVYSLEGEVHGPYDLAAIPAEGLWTNTVFSDEVFVEVRLGKGNPGDAALTISEIAHIEHPEFAPRAGTSRPVTPTEDSCFIDAACVTTSQWSNVANASTAIGAYLFSKSGETYVCSGGLLADTKATFTPYFLTANHCFSSQTSASSMEVFWRFKATSCGISAPNPTLRTSGGTLLATNASTDFTLVRLNGNPPSGSTFLGWSTSSLTAGTSLYRLHHPGGAQMHYARHEVTNVSGTPCGKSPTNFVFAFDKDGGTAGGSSGSPVMLSDLKVVGQLYGGCSNGGSDPTNNCDRRNYNVDGAFKATYPSIQQYLAPGGGGTGPCVAGTNKMCLLSNRFEITLTARDPRTNATGAGQAVTVSNTPGTGFGYFSIPALTGDANNAEILVKMLDATSFSNHFWVFYGALTDFDVTITVRDTTTGRVKNYQKAPLGLVGGAYTGDFPKN